MTRVELDQHTRRLSGGRLVLGGIPPRLFRLTEAGARWLDVALSEGDETLSPGAQRLIHRLRDAGALHLTYEVSPEDTGERLTVVIPVRDQVTELDRCLTSLRHAGPQITMIVVDDGSADAGAIRECAARHGVRLIRHDESLGPSAARNAGAAVASTEFLGFIDADVVVSPDFWIRLVGCLECSGAAMVAPRVTCRADVESSVTRYEQSRFPLDMGPARAKLVVGGPVSYVPSAAMVWRRNCFEDVGGFDETMRVGEDVDLIWRALDRCDLRYEPASVVVHPPRSEWRAVAAQRYFYGTSAGPLGRRHHSAVAPARWSVINVGAVASSLLAPWWVWLASLGVSVKAGTARLGSLERHDQLNLVMASQRSGIEQAIRSGTRAWWPFTVVLCLASRRFRLRYALGYLLVHLRDRRRCDQEIRPVAWLAASVLDDVSYGCGVWASMLQSCSFWAVVPEVVRGPRANSTPEIVQN